MLETRPAPSHGSCDCCPIPSRRIATNSLRKPRTYGGFELAILKPYTSSLSAAVPFIPFSGIVTPEYDYEVSPRVYLGRERCDGLGVRATYWQFDHKTNDVGIGGTWTGLEIHALDLEVTNHVEFCGSDVMLSGGLRYGDLETDLNVPPLGGSATFSSDGWGPTIGATMRRDLARPNLDFVIGGRGSLLLTDTSIDIPGLINVDAHDSTMQIWEARIGVEYTRQMRRNMQLQMQFAFEAQNWQTGSIAGLISPNFGLAGPTIRAGLSY